jgi:hypothetical protein
MFGFHADAGMDNNESAEECGVFFCISARCVFNFLSFFVVPCRYYKISHASFDVSSGPVFIHLFVCFSSKGKYEDLRIFA